MPRFPILAFAALTLATPLAAQQTAPAAAAAPSATPSAPPATVPAPITPAAAPGTPASAVNLAGLWDMVIDGTAIFRFELIRTGPNEWRGLWSRPATFNSNGDAFGNISGGVRTTESMTGGAIVDMVELSFDDPRPGAVPDVFRFRQVAENAAEMTYVGTNLRPFRLVRVAPDAPLGNWEQERIYRRPPPQAARPGVTADEAPPTGPISLRPQVRFLDLTPRPARTEDAAEHASADAAPTAPAPTPPAPSAAAGPARAVTPAAVAATSPAAAASPRPVVSPTPATSPNPTRAAPPAPAATPQPAAPPAEQPRIGPDFLEGL